MGDYSGIGDAMVGVAVLAAFAVPTAFFAIVGLVLSFLGFGSAGIIVGGIGIIIGFVCSAWVTIQA